MHEPQHAGHDPSFSYKIWCAKFYLRHTARLTTKFLDHQIPDHQIPTVVNYLNREINSSLTVGFRSELLNDKKGQRTGTATKYTENTLYLNRYFGNTFLVQSDLRFDHSWDKRGYDNGKARNQLVWGLSLVFRY